MSYPSNFDNDAWKCGIQSAVEVIDRFGSEITDERLRRWHSLHERDFQVAIFFIDYACKTYRDSEYLLRARERAIAIGKRGQLAYLVEGFERRDPGSFS